MNDTYYPGSDTKITDPFFLFCCKNGHREWCVKPVSACPYCGAEIKSCVPVGQKKEAASCN
ncbi:MAG: hypothetical protein HFG34_00450 [Eubacterium sp.]|nr:hypothetical protein [Eubacterium sp.]